MPSLTGPRADRQTLRHSFLKRESTLAPTATSSMLAARNGSRPNGCCTRPRIGLEIRGVEYLFDEAPRPGRIWRQSTQRWKSAKRQPSRG